MIISHQASVVANYCLNTWFITEFNLGVWIFKFAVLEGKFGKERENTTYPFICKVHRTRLCERPCMIHILTHMTYMTHMIQILAANSQKHPPTCKGSPTGFGNYSCVSQQKLLQYKLTVWINSWCCFRWWQVTQPRSDARSQFSAQFQHLKNSNCSSRMVPPQHLLLGWHNAQQRH